MGAIISLIPFAAWGLVLWTGQDILWCLGPFFVFVVIPIFDIIAGLDRNNPPDEVLDALEEDKYYRWVTYAFIPAQVLDQVGQTIRERNQIRRQVKALSAEGKLSAYVLMALPIGIVGFLGLTRPEYVGIFVQSPLGYGLILVCVIMLTVGALWLRKMVTVKF